MQITVDMIMSHNPCHDYPPDRVIELFAGRDAVSLRDILELDIPAKDRIWAVTRFLSDRANRLFACDCAESVLWIYERAYPGDNRPRRCIDVARRFARGEATREELAAAWAAARAAWAATRAAWAAGDAQIEMLRKYIEEVEG